MKITVTHRFFDKEANMELRLPGDVLTVTKARAEYLVKAGVARIQKKSSVLEAPEEAGS